MPHRVLQAVAGFLGLVALTSLVLGIVNAPSRGRLPGEKADGTSSTLLQATEATPLSQERIEGPPPPPELTPEEKAKLEAEKKAKAEADAAAKLAAQNAAPLPVPPPVTAVPAPAPDRVGELIEKASPAPEEPPH